MIVKILGKSSKTFAGVTYNTNKVDRGKGELLVTANFGALQGLRNLRPQDYINYLQAISAKNKRIEKPQFHTVLSSKGDLYSKEILAETAVKWLEEMGYGNQPYLVIFHKDTANAHVHAVTTRVGRDGKKINSAFEKVRAIKALDKVLGYELALAYRFSTKAQFYLLLESRGGAGKDYNEQKLQDRVDKYEPDKLRLAELKHVFAEYSTRPDFITFAKQELQLEIIVHSSNGNLPYGYTLIDHQSRQVFKGSEVLSLKYWMTSHIGASDSISEINPPNGNLKTIQPSVLNRSEPVFTPGYIPPVFISDDIDDEAILGRNRHRKRKTRTNNR